MIVVKDSHAARLSRMNPGPIVQAFGEQLAINADLIVRDAQQSILDGSGGGIRSAPGDAPNNQTGELLNSGFVTPPVETLGEIKTAAGFGAEHARYLEHGTSKMYPRPFLTPATERNRGAVLRGLATRLRQIVGLV